MKMLKTLLLLSSVLVLYVSDIGYAQGTQWTTKCGSPNDHDFSGTSQTATNARIGNFSYKANVVDGLYNITIAFEDDYRTSPMQRIFDVIVNGVSVLKGFDIFAAVGKTGVQLDKTFTMSAANGVGFKIDFIPSTTYGALCTSISITSADSVGSNAAEWTISKGTQKPSICPSELSFYIDVTDPTNPKLYWCTTGFPYKLLTNIGNIRMLGTKRLDNSCGPLVVEKLGELSIKVDSNCVL
jgi:Malectin domain